MLVGWWAAHLVGAGAVRRPGRQRRGWPGAEPALAAASGALIAAGADRRSAGVLAVLRRIGGWRGRTLLFEPLDQSADKADDVVPIGAAERGVRQGHAEQHPEQDEE